MHSTLKVNGIEFMLHCDRPLSVFNIVENRIVPIIHKLSKLVSPNDSEGTLCLSTTINKQKVPFKLIVNPEGIKLATR